MYVVHRLVGQYANAFLLILGKTLAVTFNDFREIANLASFVS